MGGDGLLDEDQFVLCCRHVLVLEEGALSDAELRAAFAQLEARLDCNHLCGLIRIRELLDFMRTPRPALSAFMRSHDLAAQAHAPISHRSPERTSRAHSTEACTRAQSTEVSQRSATHGRRRLHHSKRRSAGSPEHERGCRPAGRSAGTRPRASAHTLARDAAGCERRLLCSCMQRSKEGWRDTSRDRA
jgi:hypothetical protein